MLPPNDIAQSPEPVSAFVILHGNRDSADVIKGMDLKMGRLSWIVCVGPMSPQGPSKRKRESE